MTEVQNQSLAGLLWNGFRGRCPKCGRGSLFQGFLRIVPQCPACGLSLAGQDAGDASATFGTFIIGAVAVGMALWLELAFQPPLWVLAAVLLPVVVVGTLLVLRPIKGLSIALQYRYRDVARPGAPGGS